VSKPCPACQGEGLAETEDLEMVNIPAGSLDGFKLRLKHKGDQSTSNGPPGDLIFTLKLQSDTQFRRIGVDILAKVYIPIAEAVLGTTLEVETVHGMKEITVNPGIMHGTRVRIRGFGLRKGNVQGDHCLTVLLTMPKTLSQEEHDLYTRLVTLGKRTHSK
jgi:molecular chaperone DnaJ